MSLNYDMAVGPHLTEVSAEPGVDVHSPGSCFVVDDFGPRLAVAWIDAHAVKLRILRELPNGLG